MYVYVYVYVCVCVFVLLKPYFRDKFVPRGDLNMTKPPKEDIVCGMSSFVKMVYIKVNTV